MGLEIINKSVVSEPTAFGNFIEKYVAGVSQKKLADDLRVSRGWLRRRLVAAGIDIRGISEAERLNWQRLRENPVSYGDAVARTCTKAWAAKKGKREPEEWRVKAAQTWYENKSHSFRGEPEMLAVLESAGIQTDTQFPVGRYNLDISLNSISVAVEVMARHLNTFREPLTNHARRLEYLLSQGWTVVYVMIPKHRMDIAFIGQNLLPLLQTLSCDKSARGGYWMVRGYPNALTRNSAQFDGVPNVPGFHGFFEIAANLSVGQ